jgi:signal recognition particle receptor subunit alpha
MFELLCIFTGGGLVIWHHGSILAPLNILISEVLLKERASLTHFAHGTTVMKWKLASSLDVIFAAVYQQAITVLYVDELLDSMKTHFQTLLTKNARRLDLTAVEFETNFPQLYEKWEVRNRLQPRAPEPQEVIQMPAHSPATESSSPSIDSPSRAKPKPKAPARSPSWQTEQKINARNMQNLDVSQNQDQISTETLRSRYIGSGQPDVSPDLAPEEAAETGFFGRIANKVRSFTGNKQLTEEELEPVLQSFRQTLIGKNVAEQISAQLCESIKQGLMSTHTASFTTVHQTVRAAIASSLEKLLTPQTQVDPLREAMSKRGGPYVIVFVGVNGVGKSTSLAKVAYMLKTKGELSLMIAACDTFRAGAVEQLRTHCRALDVPLFEQGYGKEPAFVAKEAIRQAAERGTDVVLVDTAGRQQHNEVLMQALGKLVNENKPDLVLFVGEALVGNDGVDQLVTFNQALKDRTTSERGVDGVFLTKFDTVDDKVGAALSMVYSTGKPVVFVGTGERYPNLVKFDVSLVSRALLS